MLDRAGRRNRTSWLVVLLISVVLLLAIPEPAAATRTAATRTAATPTLGNALAEGKTATVTIAARPAAGRVNRHSG